MAKVNYPCPCDACPKNDECKRMNCEKWRIWFLWSWKRTRHMLLKPKQQRDAWRYPHPDEVRRFAEHSPCEKCEREKCNKPCLWYFDWYNARMEIARKKAGL